MPARIDANHPEKWGRGSAQKKCDTGKRVVTSVVTYRLIPTKPLILTDMNLVFGAPACTGAARVSKGRAKEQDLELFILAIMLDRNSPLCLHKAMETGRLIQVNRSHPHARLAY